MRISALFIVAGLLAGSGPFARAQSLADVAKKEEERRQHVPTGKVFTNKDLKRVLDAPAADAAAPSQVTDTPGSVGISGPSTGTSAADAAKGSSVVAPADRAKAQGELKGEAYWRARMQSLHETLERNLTLEAALESRVNGLNNDFPNRDDPAQRAVIAADREKALIELERVREAVAAGPLEIAAAEEEARQAGVPPGWLR